MLRLSSIFISVVYLGLVLGGAVREIPAAAQDDNLWKQNKLIDDEAKSRLLLTQHTELENAERLEGFNARKSHLERSEMRDDLLKVRDSKNRPIYEMETEMKYESSRSSNRQEMDTMKKQHSDSKMERGMEQSRRRLTGDDNEGGVSNNENTDSMPESLEKQKEIQDFQSRSFLDASQCLVEKRFLNFNLFTKENDGVYVRMYLENDKLKGLKDSSFDKNKKTKILIPGYLQTDKTIFAENAVSYEPFKHIVYAYVVEKDYNVIVVDWGKYWNCEYVHTTKYIVPEVGKFAAEMLKYLINEAGLSISDVHVIGYDLGAHIASYMAYNLDPIKIPRITGLDPAGPNFEGSGTVLRKLTVNDAEFVDVIHTNAGIFGISNSIGHVDFYVNGGNAQKGCRMMNRDYCSHQRALNYFAESIHSNGFLAVACNSYAEYLEGKCAENKKEVMGEYVSKSLSGKYYLKTNKEFPFALEKQSFLDHIIEKVTEFMKKIRQKLPF